MDKEVKADFVRWALAVIERTETFAITKIANSKNLLRSNFLQPVYGLIGSGRRASTGPVRRIALRLFS